MRIQEATLVHFEVYLKQPGARGSWHHRSIKGHGSAGLAACCTA